MATDRPGPERRLSFDPESNCSLARLITTAVAEESGVDVTDLDPLRHAIDIQGVRAGIDAVQRNPDGSARISFSFEGHLVTVTSDGTIKISDLS